jgi:hypothetical protein
VKLPTTFVGTDSTRAFYTAVVPGFSTVAITGTLTSDYPGVSPSQVAEVTPGASVVPAVTQAVPLTPFPTESPLPVWVTVTAVIGSLMIMSVLSGRKGKNS